ncbi:MAG: phosphoribosylanthranilate isomerase, partial [Porticoccus sp.]
AYCNQFSRPYIKAIRMHHDLNPNESILEYSSARGFLFDSWSDGKYGGTGEIFDWNRLASLRGRPIILAGGLNPDNIDRAVSTLKPYALDVSGGVEASPGIKSSKLVQLFVDRCSKV